MSGPQQSSSAGLTVAVVGLGFGAAFVPLYLSHPDVARVVLVDTHPNRLAEVGASFGVEDHRTDIYSVLDDPAIDAVHLLTPVPTHADLTVAALEAGKHVACAVPLATSLEDARRVLDARSRSRGTYMMMETTAYARETRALLRMHHAGVLGQVTFYRGVHIQNLDGFPVYWQGFPPMHYATHALSPALLLLDTSVERVVAHGSGVLAAHRRTGGYDNPFPLEVGLFTLRDSPVVADVTMAFSQTARSYVEGFSVYGGRRGVEWPVEGEGPLTVFAMHPPVAGTRGNRVSTGELVPQDDVEPLPAPLRAFVRGAPFESDTGRSTWVAPHHGGSHAFLVHEFVDSVVCGREPLVGVQRAFDWTAPGICAHESALAGGTPVDVPPTPA